MNIPTPEQYRRLSALAQLLSSEVPHFQRYRGDVVYDAALLTVNEGPIGLVVRDCGCDLFLFREKAACHLRVFGEEEGKAHWYVLEEVPANGVEPASFKFVRKPAEEVIDFLPPCEDEEIARYWRPRNGGAVCTD